MVEIQGLTVCIPTHRGRSSYVADLLDSLEKAKQTTDTPVEIIVVDDSPEEEFDELDRRCAGSSVQHVRGPRPAGAKRNLAARLAAHDLLLFVDSDCLATPDLLSGHVRAMRDAPEDVAGVAGRTVMYGPRTDVWRALDFSRLHNTCFDFAEAYETVGWGVTCNLSVRRDVFQQLSGFDERAFTVIGGEDVDLGARLSDHGYRWVTSIVGTVLHRRDPIDRLTQVFAKLFTYGRADVFLTARHPSRRTWHINPFAVGVAGALLVVPFVPAAGAVAVVLPPVVAVAIDLSRRRRPRPTVYGPLSPPFPQRTTGRLVHFLRHLRGAVLDLAFDAGVVWEAVRRGRPDLALRTFVYASEPEFQLRPPSTSPDNTTKLAAVLHDHTCEPSMASDVHRAND
jgi:glycosyltransferase involved in cell wall biosynthesis